MIKFRWKSSETTVYNLNYYVVWCPKYRRKVLTGGVDIRLKELLFEKAAELDIKIEQMEIMPDHVHLFIKSSPVHSPHYIVQQLKGYTSRVLRQEFKTVKSRLPSLWTRSYYIESIGHISEDTVNRYIQDQKNN